MYITATNSSHRPVCVLEDVALAVSDSELEGEGRVVALQHCCVVIEDCQFTPGVTQEGVGPARVVDVVHCGCYQSGHLIQLVQTALNNTTERCQYWITLTNAVTNPSFNKYIGNTSIFDILRQYLFLFSVNKIKYHGL